MLMKTETEPEERAAKSAVTDQNELWETYSAPAPPARTTLAIRAFSASAPEATKIPARRIATDASTQRPKRGPCQRVRYSLIRPPRMQNTAIATDGSMA